MCYESVKYTGKSDNNKQMAPMWLEHILPESKSGILTD